VLARREYDGVIERLDIAKPFIGGRIFSGADLAELDGREN
jgi:hypothetical protein